MSTDAQKAREALGARLRAARKDAGFVSGRAFAAATGWQESKVSRIELGRQLASDEDIRIWCAKTNTQDQALDLIATVRNIDGLWLEWKRQLGEGAEKRQGKALPLYERTKVFRIWHPTLVWGTLQTAEYAAETFRQVVEFYGIPDDAEEATSKRLERQRFLTQGGRIFNVLLAEQALYSNFGGPEVMRGQLDRLLAVMGLPGMSLGIIPRSARLAIWPGNSFSMFDDKVVLVETYSAELTVTQPREIVVYGKAFSTLKRSAVYGRSARGLILQASHHFEQK
ncbi:helix-turn-helix transcriptional regulator [Streptomyces sp. NPDC000594]|uniref:helix-turn-helix domain-containing protein n=1 Tax=Streptomyces sp. NPDC000594 TaxID=3154261 RepID=UPI00331F77F9